MITLDEIRQVVDEYEFPEGYTSSVSPSRFPTDTIIAVVTVSDSYWFASFGIYNSWPLEVLKPRIDMAIDDIKHRRRTSRGPAQQRT